MKTITKKYQVYKFEELSREAKDRAIKDYYEREDYSFLKDDLTESLKALLEQYKISVLDNLELFYSLSHCQGGGLCFAGNFKYKGKDYNIIHSYRYYFAKTVGISEMKNKEEWDGEYLSFQDNKDHPFIKLYLKICNELENEGYGILEYRMNDAEFAEHCEANGYIFLKDGDLFTK